MEKPTELPAAPQNVIDRYPGPKPYDESANALFFGRGPEIRELFEAVTVHQALLLHGESGLGKSSLINAGLLPRLRQDYSPVLLRFKDHTISPAKNIRAEIQGILKDLHLPEDLPMFHSLWYIVKFYNLRGETPVLIFDQFEEFSVFEKDEKEEFYSEISAITTPEPEEIVVFVKRQLEATYADWFAPPQVKLIFSLRSDKLLVMEDLCRFLPVLQRNRYKLKPVQWEFVRQLIVLPAITAGTGALDFRTKPFTIDPAVTEDILDVTRDKKHSIETTQLQMICQEIEMVVKEKQRLDETTPVVITSKDFSREKLRSIPAHFYARQLEKIKLRADIHQLEFMAIRWLIERKLLVKEKRTPMTKLSIKAVFVDYFRPSASKARKEAAYPKLLEDYDGGDERLDEIMDFLLELRLIRDQPYGDEIFYEISHDALLEGILQERNEWDEAEKIKELEKEKQRILDLAKKKQEDLDKLEADNNKLLREQQEKDRLHRNNRFLRFTSIFISVVFVGFSCYLLHRGGVRDLEFRQLQGNDKIEKGKNYYREQNYVSAFNSFYDATDLFGQKEGFKLIQDYSFAELAASRIDVSPTEDFATLFPDTLGTFSVYDLRADKPVKIYSGRFKSNLFALSPKGKYIFANDHAMKQNFLISLDRGLRYQVSTDLLLDYGYFAKETCFYYKTSNGYFFYTLPGFPKPDIPGISSISALNPVDRLQFSADDRYAYIMKGKQQTIYDLSTSKPFYQVPAGSRDFKFSDQQPVFCYFDPHGQLTVNNYAAKKEIKLPAPPVSWTTIDGDRMLVMNYSSRSRLLGLDRSLQYSYVINLRTGKVFKVPGFINNCDVDELSSEKYILYRRNGVSYIYNAITKSNHTLRYVPGNYAIDNARNIVYYINRNGNLTGYRLNDDSLKVYGAKLIEFRLMNNASEAVFFSMPENKLGLIDLRTGDYRTTTDLKGSIVGTAGDYLEVRGSNETVYENFYRLINPDSVFLSGQKKLDYWSRVYQDRSH